MWTHDEFDDSLCDRNFGTGLLDGTGFGLVLWWFCVACVCVYTRSRVRMRECIRTFMLVCGGAGVYFQKNISICVIAFDYICCYHHIGSCISIIIMNSYTNFELFPFKYRYVGNIWWMNRMYITVSAQGQVCGKILILCNKWVDPSFILLQVNYPAHHAHLVTETLLQNKDAPLAVLRIPACAHAMQDSMATVKRATRVNLATVMLMLWQPVVLEVMWILSHVVVEKDTMAADSYVLLAEHAIKMQAPWVDAHQGSSMILSNAAVILDSMATASIALSANNATRMPTRLICALEGVRRILWSACATLDTSDLGRPV